LVRTKHDLERTNRELRETMLSKEEKEVMIKEIHHRVKNNLQIVRSLIRFQLDQVQDAKVQELFQECVNRVGAMALVHEQTYLSKDLANIDVNAYFDSLVRDLVSAYNIRLSLRMDVDIQVRTLGVDTLIPLGLLINEVISNSFKHAFKGREEGTITVHLSGTEEGGLHMRIGDDGVGLPESTRWDKPTTLGMELIHTLAGQLDASVDRLPTKGTVYELHSVPVRARKRA
jgi:two-component sensor histidine kinase